MAKSILILLFICSKFVWAQSDSTELRDLYNKREFNKLHLLADSLLQIDPDSKYAILVKGSALVLQLHYDAAKPFLEKALSLQTLLADEKAWALNELAVVHFYQGDRTLSMQCFQESLSLNTTKNALKFAQNKMLIWGLAAFYKEWEKFESEHITFYFQPNSVVADKQKFADRREAAFKNNADFFEVTLKKKISFYVWNSDAEAKEKGIYTLLGFALPEFYVIHSGAGQTSGHEITHVLSHFSTDVAAKTKLINEGIAVCFDADPNDALLKIKQMREMVKFHDKISIKEAWSDAKKYPEFVYYDAGGELIARLLKAGGKEKLLKLTGNQTYAAALELYGDLLTTTIQKLEEEINQQ
ncbi:MAG: hypothetical protein HYV28_03270 [Ignavibacteriales bacterium]|nr:hypothetical protein [Ignavibacteriales bacterium]